VPPRLFTLDSDHHAYNTCFYAALARHDIEILEINLSGRILFRTLRRGDWLHLHWPSFGYYSPRVSTLRNWLRLGRYLTLLALLRLRGVRIAWTAHNLYPHDGGPSALHHAGRAVLTRLCTLILAHGPTAATIITSRLGVPPAKIREGLIGNWIDHYPNDVPREEGRAELGLAADHFTFLFIGLIRPYKNIEGLIESFSRLEGERLRLVIAGGVLDPEYQETIERLAATGSRPPTTGSPCTPGTSRTSASRSS